MRESRTYGSVRGALRNERPYRDRRFAPRNDGVSRRKTRPRRRNDEATVRLYRRKQETWNALHGCNVKSTPPRLRAPRRTGEGFHGEIRLQDIGLVRIARDDDRRNRARKADQRRKSGKEACFDREPEP